MKIDSEFKTLIPSLTSEEKSQLQESIRKEGCRDALVLWKGILIDGHNRYEICRKNKIPFKTVSLKLDTRAEVKNWIILNQLGRRNLTTEARNYLIGKLYSATKQTYGGNRKNGKSNPSSPHFEDLKRTSHRIAEQIKIGKATVERAEKFAQAVDRLSELHGEAIKNRILSRDIRATQEDILELATLNVNQQKSVLRVVKEKDLSLKDALKEIQNVTFYKKREIEVEEALQSLKDNMPSSIQTYNEDMLKIKAIPKDSIDLIVTSPPYNINAPYNSFNDNMPYPEYLKFTRKWLSKCYGLLKNDGRMCLNILMDNNVGDKTVNVYVDVLNIAREIGYQYKTTIIWNKNNVSKRTAFGSWLSASAPSIIAPIEVIAVLYKKKWKKELSDRVSDISKEEFIAWTSGLWSFTGDNNPLHPSSFPAELPLRCIKLFSFIGDTVLDPFLGTGRTLESCIRTGRKGIGIEIDKRYCDVAKARVKQIINS